MVLAKKNNFSNSRITYFSVFGAGLGIVISRIVENQLNDAIVLGICFGALGIIISLFSGFFVKWYCYILIEKATENSTGDGVVCSSKNQNPMG